MNRYHYGVLDWMQTGLEREKKTNTPPTSGKANTRTRTRTWIHDTLNACISFILILRKGEGNGTD
jgi:hypothetical protein